MVLPEEVQSELSSAQEALKGDNIGKARVCARRAVGKAFNLLKYSKKMERPVGVNEILKLIAAAEKFSAEARNAAQRLSANVLEQEISTKPIDDALLIIEELLRSGQ
jgi:hypothetical protein